MKEKGTRKYKSYRLCSNAEKDKLQRQNAWMLTTRPCIKLAMKYTNSTGSQGNHKLTISYERALIGKVPRER